MINLNTNYRFLSKLYELKKVFKHKTQKNKFNVKQPLNLKWFNKLRISLRKYEIRLFAIMRNESLRLPHFIEYYKSLGVDRFFIIDNNSTDNSIDILKNDDNIHIFSTSDNYTNHWYWMEYLLENYGKNYWCVVVDIDELFTYPNSESLTLKELATFFESEKSTSICSFLLDMYSENKIEYIEYKKGTNPLEIIPYFDKSYEVFTFSFLDPLKFKDFISKIFIGGMRKRVFGDISPPHILSKVSFFKNIEGTYLVQGMHAINGAKLSKLQGVVFHTKFLSDFVQEVKEETKRGQHYGGAFYYKHYENKINTSPNLNFYFEGSVKFENNEQLLDLGIMKTIDKFEAYCKKIKEEID